MKTLQEQFIATKGAQVTVDGRVVVQMDRLLPGKAKLRIAAKLQYPDEGVSLEAVKGSIRLSDGEEVSRLHVWFSPGLPLEVEHKIDCRRGATGAVAVAAVSLRRTSNSP